MEHLDDMNICTDETVPTGVAPPTHSGNDRVPPVASEDTRIGSVESYEASFIKEEPTEDGVAGDTVSFQPTMEVLSEPRLSPKCLRKIRKPITMAFDPSQCPQCGTGNMCNRCRINKEKKKTQKAIQARMQALSSAKAVGVMESKQPKKRLEVGKKIPGKHMITSRRNDLNKNKDKKGSLVGQGVVRKPLTGAAASSHAKRLDRERAEKENNVNDFSKSSKMFSFIEHFLASCPQDRIDSLVALSPGEALMTCVGNMTYRQLAQHLYGLRVEHVQRIMRPILFRLMTHPKNFDLFNAPVDPDALGIPSYFQIIKRPMDLGTVKSVLQRGGFQTLESCIKDIDLVFDNAMLFNPVNHVVHDSAKLLQSEFHSEISTLKEKLQREEERKSHHACSLCQGSSCYLCGEKCLRVETPILVCHGPCGQKIKKNGIYFVSRDGLMLWCQKCHMGLPVVASEPSGRGRLPIMKKDLLKRRLDEEVAESWVRCDYCQRWVHQVCALFNDRYESFCADDLQGNSGDANGWFECPLCKLSDTIGERVVVQRALSPPPPPPVPPVPIPATTSLPGSPVSISKHGRCRKRPASLGDDYFMIPLKQSHVAKTDEKSRDNVSNSESTQSEHAITLLGNKRFQSHKAFLPDKRLKVTSNGNVEDDLLPVTTGNVKYVLKPLGRRGRKPKFRVNLGRPEEFNTNLGCPLLDDSSVDILEDNRKNVTDFANPTEIKERQISFKGDSMSWHFPMDSNSSDAIDMDSKPPALLLVRNSLNQTRLTNSSPDEKKEIDIKMENGLEDTVEDIAALYKKEDFVEQAFGNGESDFDSDGYHDSSVVNRVDTKEFKTDNTLSIIEETMPVVSAEGSEGVSIDGVETTEIPSSVVDKSISKVELPDKNVHQWTSAGLQASPLGDFLQKLVRTRLIEKEQPDSIVSSVVVRMVSNTMHQLEVPAAVRENFPTRHGFKVPRMIPYRQKCILLFQKIEGNDVCLFCLYVQEFDNSCPEPNKSRVYIAYLDSVEYFRPRECRTIVYHEILAGYLKWVQARGFRYCHIWACPPQRGDNFIFWCHPPHQRTPSRDRLTIWYNQMLRRASCLDCFSQSDLSNAWSLFFRQYSRRENDGTEPRGSSRQGNYSHSRRGGSKRGRGGRKSGIRNESSNVSDPFAKNAPAVDFEVANDDNDCNFHRISSTNSLGALSDSDACKSSLIQPICPPVFEGDFWINECIRLHRYMVNKAKSASGRSVSSKSAAGPFAEKAVNLKSARDILKRITLKPLSYPFLSPVDPVALKIPDYFSIVKNPMDLGTIKENLKKKTYATMFGFAEVILFYDIHIYLLIAGVIQDVRLTFGNAVLYNPISHPIHVAALDLNKMLSGMLVDFVTLRLGSILTPVPDPSTGGLDEWLQKFQLNECKPCGADTNASAERAPQSVSHISPVVQNDSNLESGHMPTKLVTDDVSSMEVNCTNDAVVRSPDSLIIYENTTNVVNLNSYHSEEAVSNEVSVCERGDDSLSVEKSVSHDCDSEGDDNDSRGNDTTESAISDEISMQGQYPAPRGFCRQDSILQLDCPSDDYARTAASLSQGENMSYVRIDVSDVCYEGDSKHLTNSNIEPSDEPATDSKENAGIHDKFDGPALGLKGVCSLMHDLSKASLRFKDDLFVIKLADSPLKNIENSNDDIVSRVWSEWLSNAGLSSDTFLSHFNGIILTDNTDDPDVLLRAPFVDSRHTFLEMCQYRHYQFDSIRRTKHSSMMLLLHLHRPFQATLRPLCVCCGSAIREVRWHCELCDHYDLCAKCVAGKIGSEHQHPLIPFRVTYF